MKRAIRFIGVALALGAATYIGLAQWRSYYERETDARPLAVWEVPENFQRDVFTFVRVQYNGHPGRYSRRYGVGTWWIDHPASQYNLSYRLQQVTAIKVNPEGKVLKLTDKELFEYPFIYIVEPGGLHFLEEEVRNLRRYLLNGGFLMVDDFWGEDEWDNFYREIKRVFPEREPEELPLSHPVFNCVLPLNEKPQIPNVGLGTGS